MKITFLGTGTSQGIPVIACHCSVCSSENVKDIRLRTSVMIENKGKVIVIDTGPDFRQQMLIHKVERLDAVLFTHEHKDHIAGLDDVRAFNFTQKKPIDIYATPQVNAALKREYYYAFEETKYPGVPSLELHDIGNKPFVAAEIEFQPVLVMHYMMPVFGFRFGDFTYITDAKTISEEEMEKAKNSKVLVLNALRKTEHVAHFNLDEALELINVLKPAKAYLTHISHLMGKHDEVSKLLPANTEIAFDGMKIEL